MPACLVIVPALNEQASVGTVVGDLRELDYDVLVVDDGSSDRTAQVAAEAGAVVLRLPVNLGVGGALQCGFRYAVSHGYDVVVQCDADGQHRPAEISRLLEAMESTGAALVIGTRFLDAGSRRGLPRSRRLAMRTLAGLASRHAGRPLTDSSSGFRAIRRPLLDLFAHHYPAEYLGDTVEAIIMAGRAGYDVRDVEAAMDVRQAGRSSASTLAASWYVLRVLAAIALGAGSRRTRQDARPLGTTTD